MRAAGRKERDSNYQQDRQYFDEREKDLHGATDFYADVIDGRHGDEPDDRKRLRPREDEVVWLNPMRDAGQVQRENRRTDARQKIREKAHAASSDRCRGSGPADDGVHPAEEKSPRWTEAAAQVGVLAARFGDRRA